MTKAKWLIAALLLLLPVVKSNAYQSCVEEASRMYGINPLIVYAIIKTESGFNPYAVHKNKNGTYDLGLMQINSSWLPFLSRYGYTVNHLFDPCINAKVGTWILARCISKFGYNWKAIDCYNKGEKGNVTGRSVYVWNVYMHMLKLAYGGQVQPNVVKTSYRIRKRKGSLIVEKKVEKNEKMKHIQVSSNNNQEG